MTRKDKRPRLGVTRDDDGGLTIHDPQSDLVVSIIATNPLANGPRGLFVEVYAYRGGDVLAEDATRREPGDDSPVTFRIGRHPTIAFYGPTGETQE